MICSPSGTRDVNPAFVVYYYLQYLCDDIDGSVCKPFGLNACPYFVTCCEVQYHFRVKRCSVSLVVVCGDLFMSLVDEWQQLSVVVILNSVLNVVSIIYYANSVHSSEIISECFWSKLSYPFRPFWISSSGRLVNDFVF